MKFIVKIVGVLMLVLIVGACGTSGKVADNLNDKKSSKDEYHLPILKEWKKTELTKERIGNGTIDLWKGDFSFEGDLNVQLEQYLSALADMGYEVEVKVEEEFMKNLEFTKEVKGIKHFGSATFHNNQVQTTSQIFLK